MHVSVDTDTVRWYHFDVRTKHRNTLRLVFTKRTPTNIRWTDVMAMLASIGVEVSEGSGSRVRLVKDANAMVIHRPHPRAEIGQATVRDLARFLASLGVEP